MDHRSRVVQWVISVVLVTTGTYQKTYEPFNTTPELIARHGYPVQSHQVLTEDGYYLTLHRIPYSRIEPDVPEDEDSTKPVVFLQHGVLASSLDWVLTGPEIALGFKLSDAGYDVWMGNLRGNDYSSKHVNFSTTQPEFWEYSWHEIGMYDLPAMLDYVLKATGESNLHFVGHSMGATIAVVLLSEKPHYNDKLKVTVLLAPVVKLEHNTSIFRHSAPIWKALQRVTSFSGLHGFPPNPQLIKRQLEPVCEEQYIGKGICANILHMVAGYSKELNQTLLPILFGHYPTQTSIRTLSHFLQGMNTGKFSKYDHGQEGNMKVYKRSIPLEYQVSQITAPVAIFWGDSDPFTDREDISWLADQLPNLVGSFLVPSESFSHLSFLWATDVSDVLYDPVIRLLDQHKNH